jgi:long-chain acyl-CoA synthetase
MHEALMERLRGRSLLRRALMDGTLAASGWLRATIGWSPGRLLFRPVHRAFGERLRLMLSAGSALSPVVQRDFLRLGFTLGQAYGLTETAGAATATPFDGIVVGSVGPPMRGVELRIHEPDADGVGEVWIRGPIVMEGYHQRPQETAEVMQDGWFRSGDLGRIAPKGGLSITGRIKEVIVLESGKNIYPEEIEDHYARLPSVRELCVLARPAGAHGSKGEKLHAVVVPDWERLEAEGISSVRDRIGFDLESASLALPSYQRVLSFELRRDALPRTATRKLQRYLLRAELDRSERAQAGPARPDPPEAAERLSSPVGQMIADVLRKRVSPDVPLQASSHLELDLGLDSMNRVEALLAVESTCAIAISDEEAAGLRTVDDLLRLALSRAADPESAAEDASTSWSRLVAGAGPQDLPPVLRRPRGLLSRTLLRGLLGFAHLLAKLFLRVELQDTEQLPQQGPLLVCANHASFLDGFVLSCTLPWRLTRHAFVLGERDYIAQGVAAPLARFVGLVPTDPNRHLRGSMLVGAAGLKQGRTLILFPEGSRSANGKLQPLKLGAPVLSAELDCPITPVVIQGTFEAWPRGARWPRPGRVTLRFGPPLSPGSLGAGARSAQERYQRVSQALKQALIQLGAEAD